MSLSIVIPVAKKDSSYKGIIDNLKIFPATTEIIFSGDVDKETTKERLTAYSCLFLDASDGRAMQMNEAARLASHDWILFLHCDSRFNAKYASSVLEACKNNEDFFILCLLEIF